MTTMQKFKAYFGMVPPSDYEDEYLEDVDAGSAIRSAPGRKYDDYYGDIAYSGGTYRNECFTETYRPESYGANHSGEPMREPEKRRERFRSPSRYEEDICDYASVSNGGYVYTSGVHGNARLEPLHRSPGSTLRAVGAAASLPGEAEHVVVGEGQKITTLRPTSYSEARTIGERFRSGSPVIMDLVDMSNEDAKRVVDFAAGLAFALRGTVDKVATKVFLLAPADIAVSPEDRRRIAETGFYSHS